MSSLLVWVKKKCSFNKPCTLLHGQVNASPDGPGMIREYSKQQIVAFSGSQDVLCKWDREI